jgi:hypothetical protein
VIPGYLIPLLICSIPSLICFPLFLAALICDTLTHVNGSNELKSFPTVCICVMAGWFRQSDDCSTVAR